MDNLISSKEWQKLAEMDLMSAEYLLDMRPVPFEIICYHCQQSAEKYLKGYLVLHGMNPPKTHDLNQLQVLCSSISDNFVEIADQCSDLTAYGIQPRYTTQLVLEERDMQEALVSAKSIRDFIIIMIGQRITKE